MHCLTIKAEDWTYEIHMLNPGEHFPLFGGSSRGLYAGKTASLIVREHSPNAIRDTESDISAPHFWRYIAELINGEKHAQAILPEAAQEPAKKKVRKKA